MTLSDILTSDSIIADLKAVDRWAAIDELIDQLVAAGRIALPDRNAVSTVIRRRESSMSTGIGYGIGIPHASTNLIKTVVGAFGRSRAGVAFDALDGQPVKLVVLFLVPQGEFQKHLHTLADIAKLLHRPEFRQALEDAPDAAGIYRIIRENSGA
jgi:mannitol/fructose-specific phosphotransferase system IIA component (Ntr-type)